MQHLEDSAAMAGILWDTWVSPNIRQLIGRQLNGGATDARTLYTWLAGIHDVGKATPAFAGQVELLRNHLDQLGLAFTGYDRTSPRLLPHAVAGQHLLTAWLRRTYDATPPAAESMAIVVGGHHGTPPDNPSLDTARKRPHLVGAEPWHLVQHDLLTTMAQRTGADKRLREWGQRPLPPTVQVLLTGLVIMADWLASDEHNFPYEIDAEAAQRAAHAWNRVQLPPPWLAEAPPQSPGVHLRQRFPVIAQRGTHPAQEALVQAAWDQSEPGMLLLEAPMGQGKTEAALAATEVLAHRWGCSGVYLALPTMATSDAMFTRVTSWLQYLPSTLGQTVSTYLAHSTAHMNQNYQGLFGHQHPQAIYDEESTERAEGLAVVADAWLQGRKKGLLADFVVGTIDHVLMASLMMKHLALRHLGLAGKVVVIDEVHAADAYMQVYLRRSLQWLGAYGTPVVLLSATLPPNQRDALVDAYRQGSGRRAPAAAASTSTPSTGSTLTPLDTPHAYPVVTSATSHITRRISIRPDPTGNRTLTFRQVSEHTADGGELIPLLQQAVHAGGCVAVLRNTVRRAQETYRRLQAIWGDAVTLLHSRFLTQDRLRAEDQLRAELGPEGAPGRLPRPKLRIVVATQVIEQSLDVDFDLMISDLAPIDLLLQRAGRLHRHQRNRPAPVTAPTLWVTGAAWSGPDHPPAPEPGSVAVYHSSLLLRAAATVFGVSDTCQVALPSDIPRLVAAAYDTAIPGPSTWHTAIEAADTSYAQAIRKSKAKAENFLLRPVRPRGSLTGWLTGSVPDDDTAGRQQVRDSEDGIEVLVVQQLGNECYVMPTARSHAGQLIPHLHGAPDDALARSVAQCRLRLPQQLTRWSAGDRIIDQLEQQRHDAWQQSRWLQGELVLHLDAEFTAILDGWQLRYDPLLGLCHEPVEHPGTEPST